ncbi:MAG TPA: Do family serine endopeptidase [Gemmataceae bacterium]|nr:Do family serine endopeptidase [Gemmataceae bacterium]
MKQRWSVVIVCLVVGAAVGSYAFNPVLHGQAPVVPAIPRELTSYRDIVKRVLPAVVSIETRAKVKPVARQMNPQRPPRFDPNMPDDFRRFFEEFGGRGPFEMLPDQQPRVGFGSGFIVDTNGVVLTNNHVVAGADEVVVQMADGRKFTSTDVKTDRKTDLAIVRLKGAKDLPWLEFGDSDAMEIGDRVLAVGAPFGLAGTVTHGIVSAKGRNGLNMNMYEDFLQTDAAINPGNSGGPLINLEGKVIGINAAIKSRSGGFQGVGLAITSNMAKNVVKSLAKDGVVRRGYLGVQIRELAPVVAERMGVPKGTGVVVGEVFENSPAAKAGLKAGDIITSLGGKTVKDGRSLQTTVAGLPLKKAVELTVVRDGKTEHLQVTVEEQPEEFGTVVGQERQPQPRQDAVAVDKVGIEVADLTNELAQELGYKQGVKGAVIMRVEPGSAAAMAGLQRGMLITRVDRETVASAAAAREALNRGSLTKGLLLQVRSPQGGVNFVLLQAGGNG